MAEKIYKLSVEQLNDIVSDAVEYAIKNLENVEISQDNESRQEQKVKVGDFSDNQYKEAMEVMAANRGKG